jgi:uncharacterized protein (UPF0210 family)
MTGSEEASPPRRGCRVRTITAGVELARLDEMGRIEAALDSLARVRSRVADEGYEIQTIRIALPPVLTALARPERAAALTSIQRLDRLVSERGALLSLGPALVADCDDRSLASWVVDILTSTSAAFTSITVASAAAGICRSAARAAAEVIAALGRTTAGGSGNFRFAAAANIPAGTPFFPVGWHEGADSLAVGLEGAGIVQRAVEGAVGLDEACARVRDRLLAVCTHVDTLMQRLAAREGRRWLGIDTSPAPLQDVSIGAAIEALSGHPFGSPATLEACAIVTAALRDLPLQTCGYCGLMLPVLEDRVLAERVSESRFDLRDLLLYSSVCGTGLDMVPLPGDASPESLAGIVTDVAALSDRLRKPLSARLYLVPGKGAGELAHFDDPFLTDARVMSTER